MPLANKEEFKEYCLRALGKGAIEINVTDDQVNDRVDDAIQLWQQHHFDASLETYVKYQLTQQDIDNEYIDLPDELGIERVLRVVDVRSSAINNSVFGIEYQFMLNDVFGLQSLMSGGGLANYVHHMQYINMMKDTINGQPLIPFQYHGKKLHLASDQNRFVADKYIILHVRTKIDPETITEAWNDRWLKKYCTALIKKQWGENLSKYGGVVMIGGVTMNGDGILSGAEQDIEKYEQELRDIYEEPVDMMWG